MIPTEKLASQQKLLEKLAHEMKACIGGFESAFNTVSKGKGNPEKARELFDVTVRRLNRLVDEIEGEARRNVEP